VRGNEACKRAEEIKQEPLDSDKPKIRQYTLAPILSH